MKKTPSGWGGIFGPETRAYGLPIDAPDGYGASDALRHTYASVLLVAGVDVYYVSRMPGHASIRETAATYCHWLPANRRGALDVPMTPRRIPERHDLQPTCNQTGRFLPAGCASG